jgi:hypothetical protein
VTRELILESRDSIVMWRGFLSGDVALDRGLSKVATVNGHLAEGVLGE